MNKAQKKRKLKVVDLTKMLKIKDIELSSKQTKRETFVLDNETSTSLKAISIGLNMGKSSLLRIALHEFTLELFQTYPEFKKIRTEISKKKEI